MGERNRHDDTEIEGFCSYCKDPIYVGKPYTVKDDEKYHTDCHEQMERYVDPFGLDGSEEE